MSLRCKKHTRSEYLIYYHDYAMYIMVLFIAIIMFKLYHIIPLITNALIAVANMILPGSGVNILTTKFLYFEIVKRTFPIPEMSSLLPSLWNIVFTDFGYLTHLQFSINMG